MALTCHHEGKLTIFGWALQVGLDALKGPTLEVFRKLGQVDALVLVEQRCRGLLARSVGRGGLVLDQGGLGSWLDRGRLDELLVGGWFEGVEGWVSVGLAVLGAFAQLELAGVEVVVLVGQAALHLQTDALVADALHHVGLQHVLAVVAGPA